MIYSKNNIELGDMHVSLCIVKQHSQPYWSSHSVDIPSMAIKHAYVIYTHIKMYKHQ